MENWDFRNESNVFNNIPFYLERPSFDKPSRQLPEQFVKSV